MSADKSQTAPRIKRADSPAPPKDAAESPRFLLRLRPENPGWAVPANYRHHAYHEVVTCDEKGMAHCRLEPTVQELRVNGFDLIRDSRGVLPPDVSAGVSL